MISLLIKATKVILPVTLAILLLVVGCSSDPEINNTEPTGTRVGDRAPDFQLENLSGEVVALSKLQGRPVMVNFWATWCTWCRVEMPYIQEIYEGWSGKPPSLVVLAINVGESASTARNFMQSYHLSFPVLLDIERNVTQNYRIMGYPTTFFIDENGIIQGKKVGAFRSRVEIESYLSDIVP